MIYSDGDDINDLWYALRKPSNN